MKNGSEGKEMSKYQVWFLPWVKFDLTIGPIEFWPYYEKREEKLPDNKLREFLNEFFKSYVDYEGNPVETITVCSYKGKDFGPLNEPEIEILKKAVYSLAFMCIAPQVEKAVIHNDNSYAPPTTNLFALEGFLFKDLDKKVFSFNYGMGIIGGFELGKAIFHRPKETGGPGVRELDENLREAFDNILNENNKNDFKRRLFRSLEWFYMAHIGSWHVSDLTKVVMMATAFEILLNFPKQQKSIFFANLVEDQLANEKFTKELRKIKIGAKEKEVERSKASWWAYDFYQLRNSIVHGDAVVPKSLIYKDWITHLIVADIIFLHFIKLNFYREGYIVNVSNRTYSDLRKERWKDGEIELLEKGLIFMDFASVYEQLEWI